METPTTPADAIAFAQAKAEIANWLMALSQAPMCHAEVLGDQFNLSVPTDTFVGFLTDVISRQQGESDLIIDATETVANRRIDLAGDVMAKSLMLSMSHHEVIIDLARMGSIVEGYTLLKTDIGEGLIRMQLVPAPQSDVQAAFGGLTQTAG